MVKGKGGEWEERTDGVMQVLRTICLKCRSSYLLQRKSDIDDLNLTDGAALFYTTPVPSTLQVLRQYALHLLFMPPAPSANMATSSEVQAPVRKIFPFTHKPNTLDRDRIVVPAGWDSWGKITVLREGFDAKMWGEVWERDLAGEEGQTSGETSAKKAYANLVPDQGPKVVKDLMNRQPDSNYSLSCSLASPSASIQQSHARTSVPCQELRRKCKEVRQRSPRCLQKPSRLCRRRCWNCWSFGKQQLQSTKR